MAVCILGVNIYTRQAHSGYNISQFWKLLDRFPARPENATFVTGENLSEELEQNNITSIGDMFGKSFKSLVSYIKEPYPGTSLFFYVGSMHTLSF